MSSNDVILLQSMLENDRTQSASKMTPTDHHTFFAARHYLKQQFSLGHDDLLSGIVDGTKDCGIDAMYLFVNSMCLRDDDYHNFGRRPTVDLVIMQVKNSSGFTEPPLDKLIVNLPKLLDFGRDEDDLIEFANRRVIEISRRFLNIYRRLDMPELHISVAFASLRADHLHPSIERKANELNACIKRLFGGSTPRVDFLDAVGLSDLARKPDIVTRKLFLAENPISTSIGGYIGVVRLRDYDQFITTRTGELDATLFEANVRDYEGETAVNRSIQETLETSDPTEDFWWLNNGVTIVASKVQPANKVLELEAPQIVNGLQTSHEIFKRRLSGKSPDDRSVLVKVIQAAESSQRERIIRATNSQTPFGPSTLRATDKVQRQIEEYLSQRGLYYERRRRYYFNQSKPVDKIISIDEMGQAVLSVLVQTPHIARVSPGKIFEPEIYDTAFQASWDLATYGACIDILRDASDYLTIKEGLSGADDYRYHLAMLLGMAQSGKETPSPKDIALLIDHGFPHSMAGELLDLIKDEYAKADRTRKIRMYDRLAKDQHITQQIFERGRRYLRGMPAASGRRARRAPRRPISQR
ncbi:AIPR family protein [Actinoplanes ianthinogenes]|uniref:AIPR family protein n=1 Tax=Actinoplanes ianthinogenes TaxID=122358 RepID=UPI00167017A1|nr:AIPR family protein [Actinoplanes ianthinogenes]